MQQVPVSFQSGRCLEVIVRIEARSKVARPFASNRIRHSGYVYKRIQGAEIKRPAGSLRTRRPRFSSRREEPRECFWRVSG